MENQESYWERGSEARGAGGVRGAGKANGARGRDERPNQCFS